MTHDTKEGMAKKLHEWYLEATDKDGAKYNYETVVPYDDLPEGSKLLDRYIAEKVIALLHSEREKIKEKIAAVKDNFDCDGYNEHYCGQAFKAALSAIEEEEV